MRNLTSIINNEKLFTGDGLNHADICALLSDSEDNRRVFFRTTDVEILRSKLLYYCEKYQIAGTTTKHSETVLEFTYGGPIFVREPNRMLERFQEAV